MILGSVKIMSAIFRRGNDYFFCGPALSEYLKCTDRYASERIKEATPLNMDSSDEDDGFWLLCVQDCFDPPIAIVRASHADEALEIFVDELDWAHISDEDLKDYEDTDSYVDGKPLVYREFSENVNWNNSGQAYDSEGIYMCQVKLHSIEVE
jgi:hypothetical protein